MWLYPSARADALSPQRMLDLKPLKTSVAGTSAMQTRHKQLKYAFANVIAE